MLQSGIFVFNNLIKTTIISFMFIRYEILIMNYEITLKKHEN